MSNQPKKKNSRVGLGQKPRGVPQPAKVSADAVQQAEVKQPVPVPENRVETPNVPAPPPAPETLQNLESAETASVAASDGLDELLEKSKDDPGGVVIRHDRIQVTIGLSQGHTPETSTDEVFGPGGKIVAPTIEHGPHGAIGVFSPGADHDDKTDAAAIAGLHAGDFDSVFGKRPTIADIEEAMSQNRKIEILPSGEVVMGPLTGERPDGTYGLVITIPEGYIDPIKEQAESDRMSPEEWCSMRFQEVMDSWWQRAPSR